MYAITTVHELFFVMSFQSFALQQDREAGAWRQVNNKFLNTKFMGN